MGGSKDNTLNINKATLFLTLIIGFFGIATFNISYTYNLENKVNLDKISYQKEFASTLRVEKIEEKLLKKVDKDEFKELSLEIKGISKKLTQIATELKIRKGK